MEQRGETGTIDVVVQTQSCDLAIVDAIARLQLAAHRTGRAVRVRGLSREQSELVRLAGLEEALGLEPLGQPERREPLGVEEVVQADDASA